MAPEGAAERKADSGPGGRPAGSAAGAGARLRPPHRLSPRGPGGVAASTSSAGGLPGRGPLRFASAGEGDCPLSYAAEWLLDNYHIVRQSLRQVRTDLPASYFHRLPKLTTGPGAGRPRVYEVAVDILATCSGHVDLEQLERYIAAYQDRSVLTTGEIWALPIMLRIGVVAALTRAAGEVARRGAARGHPADDRCRARRRGHPRGNGRQFHYQPADAGRRRLEGLLRTRQPRRPHPELGAGRGLRGHGFPDARPLPKGGRGPRTRFRRGRGRRGRACGSPCAEAAPARSTQTHARTARRLLPGRRGSAALELESVITGRSVRAGAGAWPRGRPCCTSAPSV